MVMILIVCSWKLLVRGEGRAPEIISYDFCEIRRTRQNIFIGHIAHPLAYLVT